MTDVRRSVVFSAPGVVTVETSEVPAPGTGEVLVCTELSAISSGSELLFFRGQAPADLPADSAIAALAVQPVAYPIRYGYACVGRVVKTGAGVDSVWCGRRVFVFHPHSSHLLAPVADLLPVPDGVGSRRAALLPNVETAVNFVMDGAPLVGERVAIFGLGIVGLLTTALLARFPLTELVAVDPVAARRSAALTLGATAAVVPEDVGQGDFDLAYEISGNPLALDAAIAATGFAGRIVIGSWYGEKQAPLQLGGAFHRSRIRLVSSQVSTIDPRLGGRWTKARRFELVWHLMGQLETDGLVTHTFPVEEAAAAYRLVDSAAADVIQVLLSYRGVTNAPPSTL